MPCMSHIYNGIGIILLTCVYSAGVGRTGCFIVIDSMLERMRHEKMIDIYGHVTCLRAQRNYMVQVKYSLSEFSVILGIRLKENVAFIFVQESLSHC